MFCWHGVTIWFITGNAVAWVVVCAEVVTVVIGANIVVGKVEGWVVRPFVL